jgi:hypothetical protein
MVWTSANGSKCPVSPADRGEFMKTSNPDAGLPTADDVRGIIPRSTPEEDKFKRTYAVEIEFDTPIDFAEQDRLACVVLEKLVDGYWSDAAAGTQQGNMPIKVIAYPIPDQGR